MTEQKPTPEEMMTGMVTVIGRQMKYVILILIFLVGTVIVAGGLGYQSVTIIAAVCFAVTIAYVMVARVRRMMTRVPTDKP